MKNAAHPVGLKSTVFVAMASALPTALSTCAMVDGGLSKNWLVFIAM